LGGLGKVAFMPQLLGTALAITIALTGGFVVYAVLKKFVGLRLDPEQEFTGADLTLHKVSASPENESGW
jgi:Amt family ammonium transporter